MTSVLHVLEALEGGTARHLVDVVSHVPECHHEVVVPRRRVGGVTDLTATQALVGAGARIHLVEMRRQPAHPANAAALVALGVLVRRLRPDVIHGHSSVGGALARLAAIGTGVACAYTPNGLATGGPALGVERLLGRRTQRVVAVSPSEAELICALGIAPGDRVVTIANGIDLNPPPDGPDLRARLGVASKAPLVGTVARLVPQKAPEVFVRAAAVVGRRVPEAHFVLVGSGPLDRQVRDEMGRAGLGPRFHLVAEMATVAAVLGQLDAYVLCSRFEGAPYTPLEAMRAGTPVVVSDVVGSRDAVEDGVSGLVVPAGDVQATAAAVIRLLGDPALAVHLADAARARLAERFDVRAMGRGLAGLYAELSRPVRTNR